MYNINVEAILGYYPGLLVAKILAQFPYLLEMVETGTGSRSWLLDLQSNTTTSFLTAEKSKKVYFGQTTAITGFCEGSKQMHVLMVPCLGYQGYFTSLSAVLAWPSLA